MLRDIWLSFRRMPLWVQVWVCAVLAPVNLLSLAFLNHPGGGMIASLAIGGMAMNLPILLKERGFSKAMAFPHLVFWGPLVIVLLSLLAGTDPNETGFRSFLKLLLLIDCISPGFDIRDAGLWLRGDREIA